MTNKKLTEEEKLKRVKKFIIPKITAEDLERGHQNYLRLMEEKRKSCLSRWYPLIEDIVPTPKTWFIKSEVDLRELWDCMTPEGFNGLVLAIQHLAELIGTPCFLRSGMTSNKHDWKNSCYLPNAEYETVVNHVSNIVEFAGMADLPMDVWVVRELLPTFSEFTAFYGNMPITRERRYFIKDGKILCHHPYWRAIAIEGQGPSVSDWFERLSALNYEGDGQGDDCKEIIELTKLSEKVASVIEGFWSVDWLYTKNGWYLIDMAVGESSYHWPDCPHNPYIQRTDVSPMLESIMDMQKEQNNE